MKMGPDAGFVRRARDPRSFTEGPGAGRGFGSLDSVAAGAIGADVGVAAGAAEAEGVGCAAEPDSAGAGVSWARASVVTTRASRT